MPEVSEVEKCRSKRSVVESTVTKSTNRIKELIAEKGSVSKVCQFAKSIEEARDKARDLTEKLEDIAPESIETDGLWLEDLEYNVNEVLGEVSDYLAETRKTETQTLEAHSRNVNKAENSPVLSGEFQFNKGSGLKGVKVPTFEGTLISGHISGVFSVRLFIKTELYRVRSSWLT